MVLGSRIKKLSAWGCRRLRIGVLRIEECLDVIDCVIRFIKGIFVRCRCVNEVTGSSVFNILLDFFHLEAYHLRA